MVRSTDNCQPLPETARATGWANDGIRTRDHQCHKLALYQLSYIRHFLCQAVRQDGVEPPTHCLEGSCSIQLSYWHIRDDWI